MYYIHTYCGNEFADSIQFNSQNIKDYQAAVVAVTPAAPIEIQLVAAAAEKKRSVIKIRFKQ